MKESLLESPSDVGGELGQLSVVDLQGNGDIDRRRLQGSPCGKRGAFSKWLWEGAKRLSKEAVGNLWARGRVCGGVHRFSIACVSHVRGRKAGTIGCRSRERQGGGSLDRATEETRGPGVAEGRAQPGAGGRVFRNLCPQCAADWRGGHRG